MVLLLVFYLIQSSMPSAVLTYLVGSMYSEKKVVDSVASVIVTSTLNVFYNYTFCSLFIVLNISSKYSNLLIVNKVY